MSKSIIGEHLWAEMTEVQKVEAVCNGRATLKQMTEGLLDGSDALRRACRDFLSHTDASLGEISTDTSPEILADNVGLDIHDEILASLVPKAAPEGSRTRKSKQRFGLPEGFTPRLQRCGRSVLLKDNVYRLPDKQEFIPQHPSGTLGKLRHLYALLTPEQFGGNRRGSVYVRTDGRIFDYSVDHGDPAREMFDTGYTIHDLERTGRYAVRVLKKRKAASPKLRQAARAG